MAGLRGLFGGRKAPMPLLVGLGNPGSAYARHRHNLGFMAIEMIARRHRLGAPRSKFQGRLFQGQLDGRKILALCPQTFMNDSGRSVAAAKRFYKIPVDNVIVIHDEIDLAPGKVRVKTGGGSAGHNGLRSLDAHIGNGYRRVRVGVGHPGHKDLVHGYLLHDFSKAEFEWLDPLLEAIAEAVALLTAGEDSKFMSRVALLARPVAAAKPGALAGEGDGV